MKSNFEFLINEWNKIYDRAKKAEEFAFPDTRVSCIFARMALELAIELAFQKDYDLEKKKCYETLKDLMNDEVFKRKVGFNLSQKIHQIRIEGNNAVHNSDLKFDNPKIILNNLHEFTKWFHKNYSHSQIVINEYFDDSFLAKYKDIHRLTSEELFELQEQLKLENKSAIEEFQKKITELEEILDFQLKKNAEQESEIIDLKRLNLENQNIIELFNQLKKTNNKNESFFSFDVIEIGLTLQKGLIWGRVFINFKYDNQYYYAVKYFAPNELGKAQEKHLISGGNFQESELYNLFDIKYDNLSFEGVSSGEFDNYDLVLSFDKRRFGTPSLLIEKLILDLKKQFAFKKDDNEWQENGFYIIDNKEYMSIWTFKNHYNSVSENSIQKNRSEAIVLLSKNIPFYISKPDFGSFNEIKIYPVEKLKEFYNIKSGEVVSHLSKIQQLVQSFQNYFHACPNEEMDYGTHGPELINNTVYVSVFHYLEFKGLNPRNYDTDKLGNYLTGQSNGDNTNCKYVCKSFSINN